jgi:hypothetical protein
VDSMFFMRSLYKINFKKVSSPYAYLIDHYSMKTDVGVEV